jgi:hypothetical protein
MLLRGGCPATSVILRKREERKRGKERREKETHKEKQTKSFT